MRLACTQVAIAEIENEVGQEHRETGCEGVGQSLNQEVASLSESARGTGCSAQGAQRQVPQPSPISPSQQSRRSWRAATRCAAGG